MNRKDVQSLLVELKKQPFQFNHSWIIMDEYDIMYQVWTQYKDWSLIDILHRGRYHCIEPDTFSYNLILKTKLESWEENQEIPKDVESLTIV